MKTLRGYLKPVYNKFLSFVDSIVLFLLSLNPILKRHLLGTRKKRTSHEFNFLRYK